METEVIRPTTMSSTVKQLQDFANHNEVFKAVCHVFALRERTRNQITVASLFATMKREGFNFTKDDYRDILSRLGEMNIGTVVRGSRGKVRVLKNISVTLQSLGLASLANKPDLQRSRTKIHYTKLPTIKETKEIPHTRRRRKRVSEPEKVRVISPDSLIRTPIKETSLQIKVGYKTFSFELFPETRLKDILNLVDQIYSEKSRKS